MTRSADQPLLRKAATLRDVARAAGVHASTASRALNEATRPMVNAGTVGKVLAAARELGYRPNSLARGLKMSRTFAVGVLIPDLTNPLFPPLVRGLEDGMSGPGYTVVAANTDSDDGKERAIVESMLTRRIDGLVVATARREHPLLDELAGTGIPLVLVVRTVEDTPISAVVTDDHRGICLAVRHLLSLGHERIAHIAGPQTVSAGLDRYRSFLWWMEHEGGAVDEDLVVFADWFQEEAGAAAFRSLLDRRTDFTAVVASNDLIALGCYDVLAERGLRVPEDISIVGYNDILFADKFNPPLTTVRVPSYDMGVTAAEVLLELIKDPDREPLSVQLEPTLVQRRSAAAPRAVLRGR